MRLVVNMKNYWETGKCPVCEEELQTKEYKEYRDSSILMQFWENRTEWHCPKCGWNSEKI